MRQQRKKLSDVITEQLESMILDGTLLAGQKLPPERELALEFDVSRPSLREAIGNLQARGLVERKQGGGTFVNRNLNSAMTDPLMDLVSQRPETQFDLLEFRHALEGMAAYYAALRGQPEDYNALKQALNDVPTPKAHESKRAQAEALGQFYIIMARASHNMVLLHVMSRRPASSSSSRPIGPLTRATVVVAWSSLVAALSSETTRCASCAARVSSLPCATASTSSSSPWLSLPSFVKMDWEGDPGDGDRRGMSVALYTLMSSEA